MQTELVYTIKYINFYIMKNTNSILIYLNMCISCIYIYKQRYIFVLFIDRKN